MFYLYFYNGVIVMQFKKLIMTYKEEKTKEDEILVKGIIEIYKEVLRGDRKRFPKGTWLRPDAVDNAGKCIKYLIEEKLKLSEEQIKERLNKNLFYDNKLSSMLNSLFDNSPFKAIESAYPGKFKPWEFKITARGYWTEENSIKATKWLIEEKLNLSDEELKECLSIKLFEENNLLGMLNQIFNGSPLKAIDLA